MESKEAKKLLEQAQTYWYDNYYEAKEDLRFSIGEGHWDSADVASRRSGNNPRPCLVINQLPQFIHQVTNDMRQNTPSINVLPIGEESDIETAKIFKGLIKNIEYRSAADEVYDTAGEYAVKCGIGFIRVEHDYVSDDSFEQELLIKRVQNPLSVWLDPASVEYDGRDAEWAIVLDTINKDTFEKLYPDRKFTSFDAKEGDRQDAKQESIVIAELFIKEYETITKEMDAEGGMIDYTPSDDKEEEKKKRKRILKKCTVCRYKFSGEEEPLEETTFPGKYIPIVPVFGEEVWVDGKRRILSLIRQSKDAQRRVNHWASKESELLTMAPVAPVMAAAGQVDDWAEKWQSPGTSMVLPYKQTDLDGNPAPPPQRLAPPPIPTGIINAMQGAKEDIKATMGMYEASLGKKSNVVSGVAYNAQKQEGDVATFHFGDNRNRSITQVGRIIVCAIPEVYDTSKVQQIIGEEGDPQLIGINGADRQDGQEQEYDLTKGKYDVRVTTGPSNTTKRQEAAQFMTDMVKVDPQLMQVAGDLLVKNMDIAGADVLAARLRKTIPPQLIADEEAKKNGQQPPDPEKMHMTQLLQAAQQQMQQMSAELQSKQTETQLKQSELALKSRELDIRVQFETSKAANDRLKIITDADNNKANIILKAEQLGLDRQQLGVDTTHAEIQLWRDAQSQAQELTADAQGAAG